MNSDSNNIQPISNTSDLSLFTVKDIILNSEIVFEFTEVEDPDVVQFNNLNAIKTTSALKTCVLIIYI